MVFHRNKQLLSVRQVRMLRFPMQSNMFTTPEHAQKLLSANERIVRLTLADSQNTSLYVHPAFL
jgi:hypothetical protein